MAVTASAAVLVVMMVVTASAAVIMVMMVVTASTFAIVTATTASLTAQVVQHVLNLFVGGIAVLKYYSCEL